MKYLQSFITVSRLFTTALIFVLSFSLTAQTLYSSNGNANWGSAFSSTGSGGANIYTIQQGDTVTLNSNYGVVDTLIVNGVLVLNNTKRLDLSANGYILVNGFGKITGGNGSSRFRFAGGTSINGAFNAIGPTAATSSSGGFSPSYLPAELISFEGKMIDNLLELKWATAIEENNGHFEIEYSTDGYNFKLADYVYSKAVNGYSNEVITYNHTVDVSILNDASIFYVRLKQVDFDGNYTYSMVLRLTKPKANNLTIRYVSDSEVQVSYNPDFDSDLNVYNLKGQIVHSSTLDQSETIKLDLPGMYIVECQLKGKTLVEKILIR